jgi:hypothetical protein
MGVIKVLNEQGDQTIEWKPEDEKSVHRAHGAFDALKAEGYEFYESKTETVVVRGPKVSRFKATLGTILAVPGVKKGESAMRGGPPASIVT